LAGSVERRWEVARTKDLTKIRDEFTTVLSNGEASWSDASASPQRKTVAEDIFLRMVVAWEEFISDWFIAAVNHDATEFKATMERRLREWQEQAVRESPYARYTGAFRAPVLTIGKNPPVATVHQLLDPREANIEFRSLEELLRRSADALVNRFVARVGRVDGAGGGEIVDTSLAIRNVLAHRSRQAVRVMNEQVAALPSYPRLRKKSMSKDGIGTYLAAATAPGGAARIVVFKMELERIARVLVP
jgi:hypothetical protein